MLDLDDPADDPPPFLGTWKRVYAAALCWLAIVILALYCFTRFYAPMN